MKIAIIATVLLAISAYITIQGIVAFDIGAFLAFVTILGALIVHDRKKVKLEGIVLMRRTKKGRDAIDRVAKKHPRFWNGFYTVGIVVGIGALILGSLFLILQAHDLATNPEGAGGVQLLLPGPVSDPVSVPGVFILPWWIWVIGIAVVIVPHELAHGIACRLSNVPIKSVGWILLVIIPGAFVEPDETHLQKQKRSVKMKVYAAGAFTNIVLAFVIFMVFATLFPVLFTPTGLGVQIVPDSPANLSGLQGVITQIDGERITTHEELIATLAQYKAGDIITVSSIPDAFVVPAFSFETMSSENTIHLAVIIPQPIAVVNGEEIQTQITLIQHPDREGAFLGVAPVMRAATSLVGIDFYRGGVMIFIWIFIFSLGVGIVNLLPIKPLDGGLLFEELVGHFTPRTKHIVRGVSVAMVMILLFNLIGPILFSY